MKPQRKQRQRVERRVHRDRLRPCRVYRVHPDEAGIFVVEVRIARDRRRMREAMNFHEGQALADSIERECGGLVRSWRSRRTRRSGIARPRQLIARMYLNERDLRRQPSEIVAHEATHAGMAWARFCRARLQVMDGEEVLCYAVGRLVKQINRVGYAHGLWK